MKHTWTYANVGGNTRVVIKTGEDIRHLGELDEKLWTVLACPSSGLEIADESLALMDHDNDGKIHIKDVVATSQWLCQVLQTPSTLLTGADTIAVDAIADTDIAAIAAELAVDGQVSLSAVKAAIAGVSVENEAAPEAPYAADVMAAYKACEAQYKAYYQTAKLAKMGLAVVAEETAAPGLSEKKLAEMGEKIAAYEAEKAAVEAKNAGALASAQAKYRPLEKLLLLHRDFVTLLRNFVSFQDFYAKRATKLLFSGRPKAYCLGDASLQDASLQDDERPWAIFQAGTLVIDQRACHLCLKVSDMGKHNAQAPDSGMFLIYCNCKHHASGQTMTIVAAMTVGEIRNLKVGKNALFYDRQGRDWEAEVVKIIDNPISIGQAFWSPYRKLGNWVSELITKSAAEKEKKSFADMTAKLQTAPAAAPAAQPAPFDIAKFAGIFAAIGMAIGALGTFLTGLLDEVNQLADNGWWAIPTMIICILLAISGPSMVLAWMKLRRRNLAPLLNANGWAVNADAIVNVLFGNTLTEQAEYPVLGDKAMGRRGEKAKGKKWAIVLAVIVVLAAVAAVGYWLWVRTHTCCFCDGLV